MFPLRAIFALAIARSITLPILPITLRPTLLATGPALLAPGRPTLRTTLCVVRAGTVLSLPIPTRFLLAVAALTSLGTIATRRRPIRARRTQLIGRDLAVVVFVEFLQGLGRIFDLLRRDGAVAIRVQRGEKWRGRTMFAVRTVLLTSGLAILLATWRAFAGRGIGRWIASGRLREGRADGKRQREREELMPVSFHVFVFGVAYLAARRPGGSAMQ